jgi:hypothetical protein
MLLNGPMWRDTRNKFHRNRFRLSKVVRGDIRTDTRRQNNDHTRLLPFFLQNKKDRLKTRCWVIALGKQSFLT